MYLSKIAVIIVDANLKKHNFNKGNEYFSLIFFCIFS